MDLNFVFLFSALYEIISRPADGGVTALHMAALNGHSETVHLLLDLGASVSEITINDGTTIDLIGIYNFSFFSSYIISFCLGLSLCVLIIGNNS